MDLRGIAWLVAFGLLAASAGARPTAGGVPASGGRLGAAVTAIVVVPVVPESPSAPVAPALSETPNPAVFQLVTMALANGGYHSVTAGTAFFVDADGTALTNSHVVYAAFKDPAHYRLLAIVGNEFYGATTVCASVLAEASIGRRVPVPLGRDVAEVHVVPSAFGFSRIRDPRAGVTYLAHGSPLPRFAPLALGGAPSVGEAVRVVGYGEIDGPAVADVQWTAVGTVSSVGRADDGTPVFGIVSSDRPRPGNSGSPVLDEQGRVLGMYTWNDAANSTDGAAIASAALDPACR